MIQKKVCMLGAFAVGKTSLVARFVSSIFSEKYHTTVGVKIDKKSVRVREQDMDIVLWDLHGEDEFQKVQASYLRGTSGYLLVVDGTRRETLDKALALQKTVEMYIGSVPFVLMLNKSDLVSDWELDDRTISELLDRGWPVFKGSARTGEGVEEAFLVLAGKLLEKRDAQATARSS